MSLQSYIDQHGIAARLIGNIGETPTVPAAAAALGVPPDHIVKTLLFEVSAPITFANPQSSIPNPQSPAHVVVISYGEKRVDKKLLGVALGVSKKHIAFAKAESAATGGADLLADEEVDKAEDESEGDERDQHGAEHVVLVFGAEDEFGLGQHGVEFVFLEVDVDRDGEGDGFGGSGRGATGGSFGDRGGVALDEAPATDELLHGGVLLDVFVGFVGIDLALFDVFAEFLIGDASGALGGGVDHECRHHESEGHAEKQKSAPIELRVLTLASGSILAITLVIF